MSIKNDIKELISNDIISSESAEKIISYYAKKEDKNSNRLPLVFGSIGGILIGLGIILILAHNWDTLSRAIKLSIAFIPLLMGQGLSLYTILKKSNELLWRETSSIFVFFGIGTSISLVSQIYHISGNLPLFILTWMLLALPFVYILKSSTISIFYMLGITYYAVELGYFSHPKTIPYYYILLVIAILPHYIALIKTNSYSNTLTFLHWILTLSIVIVFGSFSSDAMIYLPIGYISLFGLIYLFSNSKLFNQTNLRNNPYKIIGSLGTVILLLILSFDWYWKELLTNNDIWKFNSIEFILTIITTTAATTLLVYQISKYSIQAIKPISLVFPIFLITFILGINGFPSHILINILIFILGIMTIAEGAKQDHLGILNYGLMIITALITVRFFDTNITFIVRGLLFIFVGIGFFLTNNWIIKKRKNHD